VEIIVSSPPDRNFVVAEVWVEHEQWAEIDQELGTISIEFYPRRDGRPWKLDFEEALSVLTRAKAELLGA
jgi:hypothetical protein